MICVMLGAMFRPEYRVIGKKLPFAG